MLRKKFTGILICFLLFGSSLLVTVGSSETDNWTYAEWNYRKLITIDSSLTDTDLTNFPVLISFSDSDMASHAQTDGDDILFTDYTDGTQLSHELISYENGELLAWVNIPSLSSTEDTLIWMYYGNSQVASQESANEVWGENYVLVQHLDESPGDNTIGHYDSTDNNNDGTPKNFASGSGSTSIAGKIDGADSFGGDNDYVQISGSSSLNSFETITIEGWFKLSSLNQYNPIVRKGESLDADFNEDGVVDQDDSNILTAHYQTFPSAPYPRYDIDGDGDVELNDYAIFANDMGFTSSLWFVQIADENGDGQKHLIFSLSGTDNQLKSARTFTSIDLDAWYYFTAVYDGSLSSLYINGILDKSISNPGTIDDTTTSLMIGCDASADTHLPYRYYFDGIIDEIRISNTPRSSNWIQASYQIANNPGNYVSSGQEESIIPELVITTLSSVTEEENFDVIVTVDENPIQNAEVTFDGITYSTNTEGKITLTAPHVDEDTSYDITATHDEYNSAIATITVLNKEEPPIMDGWISGVVSDKYGIAIKGATVCVVISISETGDVTTKQCTSTDENGEYFISISPGTYSMEVSKRGYENSEAVDVEVSENSQSPIDFTLQKETVGEPKAAAKDAIDELIDIKIDEGTIGGALTFEDDIKDVRIFNTKLEIKYVESTSNEITFTVSASAEDISSEILAIQLDPGVLPNFDNLEILWDGNTISEVGFSTIFDTDNPDVAQYSKIITYENGEEVGYILLYTPLSEHTITISSVVEAVGGISAIILYILIAIIVAIVFVGTGEISKRF